jgi:hypothetical protein
VILSLALLGAVLGWHHVSTTDGREFWANDRTVRRHGDTATIATEIRFQGVVVETRRERLNCSRRTRQTYVAAYPFDSEGQAIQPRPEPQPGGFRHVMDDAEGKRLVRLACRRKYG